jgi:hypothetical protein
MDYDKLTDKELAGLYPGIDGLARRTPEVYDRVAWRGRPGETPPGGSPATVIIVSGAGSVTVAFDGGGLGTSPAQKFSPLTEPDGTIVKHVHRHVIIVGHAPITMMAGATLDDRRACRCGDSISVGSHVYDPQE